MQLFHSLGEELADPVQGRVATRGGAVGIIGSPQRKARLVRAPVIRGETAS